MDIVVKGRRTEVSERYRAHVREKLARLSRLDGKAFRIDVEVCHESNPRLSGMCERIELTVYSRGPVIRAEAAAGDTYAALDLAAAKLEERLRRAADRRHARQHGQLHGNGAANGAGAKGTPLPGDGAPADVSGTDLLDADRPASGGAVAPARLNGAGSVPEATPAAEDTPEPDDLGDVLVADGPLVVRQKIHQAPPMTLDEALHQMELVGHDFYLYCDAESGLPSVVYRRRGYAYGVLRLKTEKAPLGAASTASAGAKP